MFSLDQHIVDHSVVLGFLGCHPVVAVGVTLHLLDGLSGMVGYYLVKLLFQLEYLAGGNLDVGCLSLGATHRLMNHDARMAQGETLACGSAHKQHGGHRGGHTGADGGDIAGDILHGVIDAKSGIHRPAGRVDVNRHILAGVGRIEIQQLGLYHVGGVVIDIGAEEDDAVHHKTGEHIHLGHIELAFLDDGG